MVKKKVQSHWQYQYNLEENKKILIGRCNFLLSALVGPEQVEKWWDSRNMAFDEKTPREIFDKDPQEVYNYLMRFADGGGW